MNRWILRGWVLSATPFWVTSIGQVFLKVGNPNDFYYQFAILAGVVTLIFALGYTIHMRVESSKRLLTWNILTDWFLMFLVCALFFMIAIASTCLANLLYGAPNGLVVGSPFFGSSEEVVYFLHPIGIPMGSFVLLVFNYLHERG